MFFHVIETPRIPFKVFHREYSFENKDFEESEIFELIVENSAGSGQYINNHDVKYENFNKILPSIKEKVCADSKIISKYNICETYAYEQGGAEIIVSEKLRNILNLEGLNYIKYDTTYDSKDCSKAIKEYSVVRLEVGIGKIVGAPEENIFEPPTIIEKEHLCNQCGFYGYYLV
jgi:hypothetical protein